jgi:tRNA-dihydrouridine synthase
MIILPRNLYFVQTGSRRQREECLWSFSHTFAKIIIACRLNIMVKKHTKTEGSFWQKLSKPFICLAPMADVTDAVFRKIIAKYGKPDVMWTEFVSADGLISAGKDKLLIDLEYSKQERPIVAQLFTGHPDAMRKVASVVKELKFDGLDINMGCPDRAVEKQGGGAALMKDPKLAVAIIQAAREGSGGTHHPSAQCCFRDFMAEDKSLYKEGRRQVPRNDVSPRFHEMPVSVKTRLGYNKVDLEWIKTLLEQRLPALTVHLRTRKEMSDVPARWELMPEIVMIRDKISPETLIIGNGDVETPEDAFLKAKKYGCDGIMIGRGIFGKPWLFHDIQTRNVPLRTALQSPQITYSEKSRPSSRRQVSTLTRPKRGSNEDTSSRRGGSDFSEPINNGDRDFRLKILLEHTKLFEKTFKGVKSFNVMKKHFKAYVSGWDGAKELRAKLMETKNYKEVKKVIVDNSRLRVE